jgi:hypothetical protein
MDAVRALAQGASRSVVIDSWWFEPRDLPFAVAGVEQVRADRAVEVWYRVPAETARARYAQRCRPALYQDDQRLADHWNTWAEKVAPLGFLPTSSLTP